MKTMYLKAISKKTEKRKASSDKCTQHDVNESYLIKQKYLDLYDRGRRAIQYTSSTLRNAHSSLLPTYVFWFVVGVFLTHGLY